MRLGANSDASTEVPAHDVTARHASGHSAAEQQLGFSTVRLFATDHLTKVVSINCI